MRWVSAAGNKQVSRAQMMMSKVQRVNSVNYLGLPGSGGSGAALGEDTGRLEPPQAASTIPETRQEDSASLRTEVRRVHRSVPITPAVTMTPQPLGCA